MYTNLYEQHQSQLNYKQKVFCYDESNYQPQMNQFSSKNFELNRSMEKPISVPSNMVMIDQAQLMELLAAKQILDAQRAAAAKPGFNSALFISPPRMSKENKTQCTSNVSNTSVDYNDIRPLKN